ncbi:hypothetical protein ACFX13_015223 [Malus domestica]
MVAFIYKPPPIASTIPMFSNRDLEDVCLPYDDALVIKVQISNAMVSRVLVDNGYRVNILFKDAAEKMGIKHAHPQIQEIKAKEPRSNTHVEVKFVEGSPLICAAAADGGPKVTLLCALSRERLHMAYMGLHSWRLFTLVRW